MDYFYTEAREKIAEFVASHPGLSLDKRLPKVQGVTNRVLFGKASGIPVVYKYFCETARKVQEEKAIAALSRSLFIPRLLLFNSDRIMVMTRFPGRTLWESRNDLDRNVLAGLFGQIGSALAEFEDLARPIETYSARKDSPGMRFDVPYFWNSSLPDFFDGLIDACLSEMTRFGVDDPVLLKSIRAMAERRSEFLGLKAYVHPDDIHENNMVVEDEFLRGIIDLEMSRTGNDIYLLCAALNSKSLRDPFFRDAFRQGWESKRGSAIDARTMALVKVFLPFQIWIRFGWYFNSDDPAEWVVQDRKVTLTQLKETIQFSDSVF
jgi:hypothetical protein